MLYGCDVTPGEPRQDMTAIDTIAGSVSDRDASHATFTGGTGGAGLGGSAEPAAETKLGVSTHAAGSSAP